MREDSVYKIRDSVDLFLSNGSYIMAYYMNTRQRKSFRVNTEMVHLIEAIDGKNTLAELCELMKSYDVTPEDVKHILEYMIKNRIVTEVMKDDGLLHFDDMTRYSRQINYFSEFLDSEEAGILAQRKVMDSKVLIFGCGAIGGGIAIELAMAGVEHITIYDYDYVEESDASRHLFYREKYVGLPKIEALADELKGINGKVNVTCICQNMHPDTDIENIIIGHDIVINTLDEPYIGYTASKISRVCMKHSIPHYIAGGFDAHLASTGELIIPYVTPCVECYAKHFKTSLAGWKPKKHPVQYRYTEIGGLASMSLFSVSYACIEILKYLAGLVDMEALFKIRGEFLFTNMELTYLNVKKNPNCPICGKVIQSETKA